MKGRWRLFLALLLWPVLAASHTDSRSRSLWRFVNAQDARVTVWVSALDATRLALHPDATPDYPEALGASLQAAITAIDTAGKPCPTSAPSVQPSPERGIWQAQWRVQCAAPAQGVQSTWLFKVAPSHRHWLRVEAPNRAAVQTVLGPLQPQLRLGRTRVTAPWQESITQGVVHILSGWDHLAFVLALLLSLGGGRALLWALSGFTLGHSLTLAAASLGWMAVRAEAVEAAIAYSIVLLAAQPLLRAARWHWAGYVALTALALAGAALGPLPWVLTLGLALVAVCHTALEQSPMPPQWLPAVVATAFGLVHGLGFASVLQSLDWPSAPLLPLLLGFNLGVELGQCAVVATAIAGFWAAGRWLPQGTLRAAAGAALLALGLSAWWARTVFAP